jgi:hypothetical protein
MSEVEAGILVAGEDSSELLQAAACLEQALAIADAVGYTVAAARIDHALVTFRSEVAARR